MAWRKTIPEQLVINDTELKGAVTLRLGWQYEPFTFDLTRDGKEFSGTYTRHIPALAQQVRPRHGTIVMTAEGARAFNIILSKASVVLMRLAKVK